VRLGQHATRPRASESYGHFVQVDAAAVHASGAAAHFAEGGHGVEAGGDGDGHLLVRRPRVVAVADEWAVKAGAAFAAGLYALVLQVGAVVLGVLVLAAAAQDPRALSDDVEEARALAAAVGALVAGLGVLLEPVAADAAALLADSKALFVAFLAAPHEHSLRRHHAATLSANEPGTELKKRVAQRGATEAATAFLICADIQQVTGSAVQRQGPGAAVRAAGSWSSRLPAEAQGNLKRVP
jgi:hypothetical protein